MAAKDFTPRQNEVLLAGLDMYVKSMTRRITAEVDPDARVVWQKKVDEANVLVSKIRST